MKTLRSSPIFLIFVTLAVSHAVYAKTTPVRVRATLLSLYAKSDAVMIGRFDKREDSGTNKVGNGFIVVTTKTYFDISTVLKGEAKKFVVIEDEEFRYQIQNGNDAPRDAVYSVGSDPADADNMPKPGDTVLLFLRGEDGSLVLADEHDGVRKISAADQSVYVDRIKELNSIFEGGKADPSKISAWLVRCAEQPATRWDGAHELLQGFRHLEWREQKDPNGYERVDPSVSYVHGSDAAKALNSELKAELTQIIVNSSFAQPISSSQMSQGDRELITLVKRWDPKTAANYILTQLKSRAFSTHENAGMMYKVAELLDDSMSAQLTRRYTETIANENDVLTPTEKADAAAGSRSLKLLDVFIRNADNKLMESDDTLSN